MRAAPNLLKAVGGSGGHFLIPFMIAMHCIVLGHAHSSADVILAECSSADKCGQGRHCHLDRVCHEHKSMCGNLSSPSHHQGKIVHETQLTVCEVGREVGCRWKAIQFMAGPNLSCSCTEPIGEHACSFPEESRLNQLVIMAGPWSSQSKGCLMALQLRQCWLLEGTPSRHLWGCIGTPSSTTQQRSVVQAQSCHW